MAIDNHTQIYGSFCNFTDRFEELTIYFGELEKIIDAESENYLKTRESYQLGTVEFTRQFHFVNDTFTKNLRTSVIVSLVTIIENELHNFCNMIKRIEKSRLKHTLLRGTVFDQFKIYINDVSYLSFAFDNNNWSAISEIIDLRNCIVHHDSNLDNWYGRKFNRIESIRNLSKKIKSIEVDDDLSSVILSKDSCNECIKIVENFFDSLYKHTLKRYPKGM